MIALLPLWIACTPVLEISESPRTDHNPGQVTDTHTDGDTGTDADADTDVDGDTDADVDGDTDTDTQWGSHPDKAGAVGWVVRVEYLGDYWTVRPEDHGYAWWKLIEPADVHWWDVFATNDDECASDFEPGLAFPALVDLAEPAVTTLSNDGGALIEMDLDAEEGAWTNTAVDVSNVRLNTVYDLDTMVSGVLPELSLLEALLMPMALEILGPAMDTDRAETLAKDEIAFSWGGADDAEMVLIELRYVDGDTSTVKETVTCRARNDGNFQVPSNAFNRYHSGDYILATLIAVREGSTVIPFNDAEFRVLGAHSQTGAFYTTGGD